MALGSTTLLPRLTSFSTPPLCSFKRFTCYSKSFFPPSSTRDTVQNILFSRPSRCFSSATPPYSTLTAASTHSNHHESENDGSTSFLNLRTEVEDNLGEEEEEALPEQRLGIEPVSVSLPSFPTPKLTIKEKKELASYAHSLGKKLKSQQIGKSGVTLTVAAAMVESLEANELLKLKVHGSCPGELSDVIMKLENATGSTAVSIIGRTLILYRPSLAKMKKKDYDKSRTRQQNNPIKSTFTFGVQRNTNQATGTVS